MAGWSHAPFLRSASCSPASLCHASTAEGGSRARGGAWDLSLARVLCFMPNAVLVVVKGPGVSGARALAEKPCDFGKSRIVLVDKDRMDVYACASDPCDAFDLPDKCTLPCHRLISSTVVGFCHRT
jgi:hypothetical protein